MKQEIISLSHDDNSREKIDMVAEMGIRVSEFPLDIEVATYAKEKNIATGMGAPNIVRGKSQSGNVSARDLVKNEVCDFLCSDYHPSSMLQAPYVMQDALNIPLEHGFAMITSNPAALAGLDDRGDIHAGKLADIIAIDDRYVPKVMLTLKNGVAIYNGRGCLGKE